MKLVMRDVLPGPGLIPEFLSVVRRKMQGSN